MIPNLSAVFSGWTTSVQLRVVTSTAVDFEAFDDVKGIVYDDAVMVPMPPQKVDRKPEGMRVWKWWEVWSKTKYAPDSVVQDQNGLQFRIQSVQDWSQCGFYHYDMTEQPT